MFEAEEGSVLDPYLFSGRPQKPKPREQYKPKHYNKPGVVPVTKSLEGVTGIFKTFQKVTSPEYQLKKANRQLKQIETSKKLIVARKELREEQRKVSEEKANNRRIAIDSFKRKLGFKEKPGFDRMKY